MKTQHGTTKLSAPKLAAYAICSVLLFTRCTQQIPGEFLLQQQNETFSGQTKVQINTKIDLLWVVDNSSSMDVEQEKLRNGFAAFAQKYMQPGWDIHLAVIPTDVYLAGPAYATYLNTTLANSTGFASSYIDSNFSSPTGGHPFVNPPGNPTLATWNAGSSKWIFTNGLKLKDFVPAWANNYGTLQSGNHDGPIAALCSEYFPYFLWGQTLCPTRDASTTLIGSTDCLSPQGAQTSNTQCVNTLENNTIHTGQSIISTLGANTQTLINNFTVNITTGTAGHGSERGMESVLELLTDNEKSSSTTKFFRQGSTRGIIFVSDEEDQTMTEPTTVPGGYNPWTHYSCDQAGLASANPSLNISGAGGVCCTGGSCQYGAEGTTCQSKTVDSTTYTIGVCPSTSAPIMPVSTVKTTLDNFFKTLDGTTTPNYFVTAIVPATGSSIASIQTARDVDDQTVVSDSTAAGGNEGLLMWSADRGDRYIQLSQAVTPGSQALDLASSDYSGVLNTIGEQLTAQKGTFTLNRAPTSQEQTIVEVVHQDGSVTIINANQYSLNGNILTITDLNVILSFVSTDSIVVNYQPLTSV
jgi:hypothetical protein